MCRKLLEHEDNLPSPPPLPSSEAAAAGVRGTRFPCKVAMPTSSMLGPHLLSGLLVQEPSYQVPLGDFKITLQAVNSVRIRALWFCFRGIPLTLRGTSCLILPFYTEHSWKNVPKSCIFLRTNTTTQVERSQPWPHVIDLTQSTGSLKLRYKTTHRLWSV